MIEIKFPDIDHLKEGYRILWKYLKRSEKYQQLCINYRSLSSEDERNYFSLDNRSPLSTHSDGKFVDIYSIDFEEWWKINYLNMAMHQAEFPMAVIDYIDVLPYQLEILVEIFKLKYDREPTLHEYIQFLYKHLKSCEWPILLINPNYPFCSIVDSLKKRLHKYEKKMTAAKDKRRKPSSIRIPSNKKDIEDLEKYLMIYDLSLKQLSWRDIIKTVSNEFSNNDKFDDECDKNDVNREDNIKRRFYRYLNLSKNIIKNLDKGIFPGRKFQS